MESLNTSIFFMLAIFVLGYSAIVFEHLLKVSKSAVALVMAVVCWSIYLVSSPLRLSENLGELAHHVSSVSQIIFFLMGAMALVELIDSHKGFKIVTDVIQSSSKRKLLWTISILTFFLSAILDNLTTTILMISLLRKLVKDSKERIPLSCMVVVAANAGGAWTPIGDVTTTMLWIDGQLSTFAVVKELFVPSLVSMIIPLLWFSWKARGSYSQGKGKLEEDKAEPGAKRVFILGILGLIFVPIFKTLTGLPPFMGIILSLGILWIVTDLMHHKFDQRVHLRVPSILARIDNSSVMFFLGILLCVDALQAAGILKNIASWLDQSVGNLPAIATLIGVFSAIVDNVPLVAACMGMYPLERFPTDHSFWMMIAYAAGTGGSLLIIGSAAGVAMMGMEKMDFITYFKKATFPVFIGFIIGMLFYVMFFRAA
ncbi:MAG: sodium:proton antiporter [Chlamydiae bacterium]|nr:sodium:proton antiporter [Chlamydiota bacterium]